MFKYFRILFGIYLVYHFVESIPYAEELYGNDMPFDSSLSPVYNIFPNILSLVNAQYYLIFLSVVSIIFISGYFHQICAFILWYGWASLVNRNIFIHNPGIPYVGWILLVCLAIPKSQKVPNRIFWLAWFLMGLGYTVSGLHKLQCPSWLDGTALIHVLNTPLARDMMLSLPTILLKIATWGSLALEILFLPLGLFFHTRFLFWITYMAFHLGIISMVNFTDLTIGVMIIHLFTFDSRWLKFKHTN